MGKDPMVSRASDYRAAAYLVECGKGELPGGNAVSWAWEDAMEFGEKQTLILAGGLTPENISIAISSALPDAVDVSSGVESSPGRKDLDKVAAFIRAVKKCGMNKTIKKVF
jgi:phosphoribosylanthranilate isomerase